MDTALPPGAVPGEQPHLAGSARSQAMTIDPRGMGHVLAPARLLQVYVLHEVLAKRCPASLLDVQEHHHVRGTHVELEDAALPMPDVPVVNKGLPRTNENMNAPAGL